MQLKELLVFGIVLAAANSVNATGDGWCDYNVTKQTSMWGKTKNFLFKKSSPNMQLMRRCCQGYKLNEQKNCEAVCEQACPENAICSAPNKCQCRHGYKQVGVVGGHLECRAICMKNDCDCQPKHCECIEGVCQVVTAVANGGSDSDSSNEQPKIADEDSQEISTVEYAANKENEHPTTTLKPQSTTTSYTPTSSEGVEENCHILGCHENALCMDNGTCACLPGFTLFHATLVHYNAEQNNDAEDDFGSSTTAANDFEATEWTTEYGDLTASTTIRSHNTETLCLSSNDLQERLNILVSTASTTASGENSVANWQLPLLIALGCISTCFVLFLVVACTLRQRQRNTGKLDVEAKNELCCEYDNKNFTQKEMVY